MACLALAVVVLKRHGLHHFEAFWMESKAVVLGQQKTSIGISNDEESLFSFPSASTCEA